MPPTPLRMTRKTFPAKRGSDHGGSLRFAGGGTIPSLRWPRPSPFKPWQMAQLAAKIAAPVCCASREANSPAGTLGAPPSHPEMTSEIMNRAVPRGSFRFSNHRVAKILHLTDNSRDKLIKPFVNSA